MRFKHTFTADTGEVIQVPDYVAQVVSLDIYGPIINSMVRQAQDYGVRLKRIKRFHPADVWLEYGRLRDGSYAK